MFKEGEKIVCVKPGVDIGLVKDKIYTCFKCYTSNVEEDVVEVLEAMAPEPYVGYRQSRFRKMVPSDKLEIKKGEVLEL